MQVPGPIPSQEQATPFLAASRQQVSAKAMCTPERGVATQGCGDDINDDIDGAAEADSNRHRSEPNRSWISDLMISRSALASALGGERVRRQVRQWRSPGATIAACLVQPKSRARSTGAGFDLITTQAARNHNTIRHSRSTEKPWLPLDTLR